MPAPEPHGAPAPAEHRGAASRAGDGRLGWQDATHASPHRSGSATPVPAAERRDERGQLRAPRPSAAPSTAGRRADWGTPPAGRGLRGCGTACGREESARRHVMRFAWGSSAERADAQFGLARFRGLDRRRKRLLNSQGRSTRLASIRGACGTRPAIPTASGISSSPVHPFAVRFPVAALRLFPPTRGRTRCSSPGHRARSSNLPRRPGREVPTPCRTRRAVDRPSDGAARDADSGATRRIPPWKRSPRRPPRPPRRSISSG